VLVQNHPLRAEVLRHPRVPDRGAVCELPLPTAIPEVVCPKLERRQVAGRKRTKADDDQPRPEERKDREEEHVGAPPRVDVLDVIDDRGGPQEAPLRHSCPTQVSARSADMGAVKLAKKTYFVKGREPRGSKVSKLLAARL